MLQIRWKEEEEKTKKEQHSEEMEIEMEKKQGAADRRKHRSSNSRGEEGGRVADK